MSLFLGAGVGLRDIEYLYGNADRRFVYQLANELKKQQYIDRLEKKIDMAQAVHFGYIGSKTKKGGSAFLKWQNTELRKVAKLQGRTASKTTAWDKLKRKSRML